MKLFQPQAMTEIGKRQNQEDAIFPAAGDASALDRLFIVCDGMGGHESGEVASNSVCLSLSSFLKDANPDTFSIDDFRKALIYTYEQLDLVDSNPQHGRKMGTTLTFLYLGNKRTIIAHIGDSRVYQLRTDENGNYSIIHKTNDHSWVSLLIRNGEITEEEAKTHPLRNQITRALQPNLEERSNATVFETNDVNDGDYFFMCSDGVLESIDDNMLCTILSSPDDSDEDKLLKIKDICAQNSRDNNSAYLVHIDEGYPFVAETENSEIISHSVEVSANTQPKPIAAAKSAYSEKHAEANTNVPSQKHAAAPAPMASHANPHPANNAPANYSTPKNKSSKGGGNTPKRPFSKAVLAGLLGATILLCGAGGYLLYDSLSSKEQPKTEQAPQQTPQQEPQQEPQQRSPKNDQETKRKVHQQIINYDDNKHPQNARSNNRSSSNPNNPEQSTPKQSQNDQINAIRTKITPSANNSVEPGISGKSKNHLVGSGSSGKTSNGTSSNSKTKKTTIPEKLKTTK